MADDEKEEYSLYHEDKEYSVTFKDGIGEKRLRISIITNAYSDNNSGLSEEYYTFISDTAADILCTAASSSIEDPNTTTSVSSPIFKHWLVSQIKAKSITTPNNENEGVSFFIGNTKFKQSTKLPKRSSKFLENESAISRNLNSEITDVLRNISDQKNAIERQIYNSGVLYDNFTKGFNQVQVLGTISASHDRIITKASSDISLLFQKDTNTTESISNLKNDIKTTIDSVMSNTLEELQELAADFKKQNSALNSKVHSLELRVREIQAYQVEQTSLWKKLSSQSGAEMAFLKLEMSKMKKTIDNIVLDKANANIQIKDTMRLLNDGQARVAKQCNAMRGEVTFLRDIKVQTDANTHTISDLKEMYLNLLPKLQQAYLSERRREANDAVHHLKSLD